MRSLKLGDGVLRGTGGMVAHDAASGAWNSSGFVALVTHRLGRIALDTPA